MVSRWQLEPRILSCASRITGRRNLSTRMVLMIEGLGGLRRRSALDRRVVSPEYAFEHVQR